MFSECNSATSEGSSPPHVSVKCNLSHKCSPMEGHTASFNETLSKRNLIFQCLHTKRNIVKLKSVEVLTLLKPAMKLAWGPKEAREAPSKRPGFNFVFKTPQWQIRTYFNDPPNLFSPLYPSTKAK